MYMRLWWKEARQFWPIWAFLMLAAGVTQLLVHHYGSLEVREGLPGPLAMGWTVLYVFSIGAAAFAGERETGTLRLLDLLPASRPVVWAGKVSFAVVTSMALAVVLLALAALDAPGTVWPWHARSGLDPISLGALVLHGLAWGLLCSAMLGSALLSAVVALGITTIVHSMMTAWAPEPHMVPAWQLATTPAVLAASLIVFAWGRRAWRLTRATLVFAAKASLGLAAIGVVLNTPSLSGSYGLPELALAAARAVLVASVVVLAWVMLNRSRRLGLRLRSPIEVTWAAPSRKGSERLRPSIKPTAIPELSEMISIAAPAPGRILGSAIWSADRPRPRSRMAELRFLSWQTMREGRRTWLMLLAIGLICPAILLGGGGRFHFEEPFLPFACNMLIALVAGVSVFGLENRRRTYRFLVHHGARPGLVWLAKLMAWCFGLAVIWGPLAYLVVQDPGPPSAIEQWTTLALNLPLGFVLGVLCGMAIPRGITAGVVALVLALAIGRGEAGLVRVGMLPDWGMLVLPAALLAGTWIWRGDWLLDRPAPGRWVRLGLLLAGTLATVFTGYAGWRAWSIPDVGPIPPPGAWAVASVPLPADRNAADLYREAGRRLERMTPQLVPDEGGPSDVLFKRYDLDAHPEIFDPIRRAAARPDCRFFEPDRLDLRNRVNLPPMRGLADAVGTHARGRLRRGDLGASWDDIVLLFRMARHLGQGAVMDLMLQALAIEKQALDLAMEWAGAPGQTPDRLRAAILAYLALPPMTPAEESVRGEGLLVERTIGLPADDLKDWLLEARGRTTSGSPVSPRNILQIDLIATPWERTRAVRLTRQATSEEARFVALEPWKRPTRRTAVIEKGLSPERESFSLAALLVPKIEGSWTTNDRNEVARRALVQVLAVREWQLRHGGRFPDRLDDLVPDTLPSLPPDPYTGRPFGYTTFGRVAGYRPGKWPRPDLPPETRLIYSAGSDGRDDLGLFYAPGVEISGDIAFPVFPVPAG
jgi:hypothetical protein